MADRHFLRSRFSYFLRVATHTTRPVPQGCKRQSTLPCRRYPPQLVYTNVQNSTSSRREGTEDGRTSRTAFSLSKMAGNEYIIPPMPPPMGAAPAAAGFSSG